jgi:hypothetical protein
VRSSCTALDAAEPPPASPVSAADDRAALIAYLAETEAACPSCGYDLFCLRADRCPECNQALALSVQLVEPRLGWWAAALVGLGAGAGFSTLLWVYATAYKLFSPAAANGPPQSVFVVTLVGALVEGACLAACVALGARIRRQRTPVRVTIAALAWGLTIANGLAFAWTIR